MAQNVSYASGDSLLESLVLHIAPNFSPTADGIINSNFLLSYLKMKERMDIVDGGLEFWGGLRKSKNSNLRWQSHESDMSANVQDPVMRLRYDIMTFAGAAVVINKKHEAMNKGQAMIKEFAKELMEQANGTISNEFNSSFWKSSPTAGVEPESIPSLISATPTVGTIGGQTRSTNTALQNGVFTTTVSDVGSESGIAALKRQIIRNSVGSNDFADLVIMGDELYAGLTGYLETLRRYKPNEKLAELDFDTIQMGKTTIGYENTNVMNSEDTITSNYVYGINSKYLKFKTLKDGNFTFDPDGFKQIGTRLDRALYFYVFCNLCCFLPRAQFVMTAVSTT